MTPRQRRPLPCRLNLHHDWHTESTEDGSRYERCRRCGKDATGPVITNNDADLLAAILFGSGGLG